MRAAAVTSLDTALARIRELCIATGAARCEITVRVDGRVTVELIEHTGYPARDRPRVQADLLADSAHPAPSEALRVAYWQWRE